MGPAQVRVAHPVRIAVTTTVDGEHQTGLAGHPWR